MAVICPFADMFEFGWNAPFWRSRWKRGGGDCVPFGTDRLRLDGLFIALTILGPSLAYCESRPQSQVEIPDKENFT